jgi:nitrogenase-stabilizing/protective protein
MRNDALEAELEGLSSAEEFFSFFGIETEPEKILVNRLHILQRFHDYLEQDSDGPKKGESWHDYYSRHLTQAYADFIGSDARTEKVFKVFRDQARKRAFVPLAALLKGQ